MLKADQKKLAVLLNSHGVYDVLKEIQHYCFEKIGKGSEMWGWYYKKTGMLCNKAKHKIVELQEADMKTINLPNEKKPKKYYTLMQRENNHWSTQFGDYSKETTMQELEDKLECDLDYSDVDNPIAIKRKDLRVITHMDNEKPVIKGLQLTFERIS